MILPLALLIAMVMSLPLAKPVRKTRLSDSAGDDRPGGSVAFQASWAAPSLIGGLLSFATPEPFGPRNWLQLSECAWLSALAKAIPRMMTVGFIRREEPKQNCGEVQAGTRCELSPGQFGFTS